jgi:endogenous inhibitor of DNA gyrase (YacG/DUF329 family)
MTSPAPKAPACPVCKRPVETAAYRPFCSKRCADVDLQRWLGGVYVVPGEPADEGPGSWPAADDED